MIQFLSFNIILIGVILWLSKQKLSNYQYVLLFLIGGIISVTQLSSTFLFDTGAYHIVLSKWVAETGLTKGIANLDLHYGLFSPIFYLGGVALNVYPEYGWQFINGAFFTMMVATTFFFYKQVADKVQWLLLFTFGVVFYFNRGYITSLSPDLWVNLYIPFFLLTLYNSEITKNWTSWVKVHSIGALFMLWIKLSSLPLIVVGVLILWVKKKEIEWKKLFNDSLFLTLLLTIPLGMVCTNIYISGYPLYPLTLGGWDVPWKVPEGRVHRLVEHIYLWGITPNYSLEIDYSDFHWAAEWIKRNTQPGFYALELFLLVTLPLQLTYIWNKERNLLFPKALAVLLFSVFLMWFKGSPNMRFLSPWLYSVGGLCLGIFFYHLKVEWKRNGVSKFSTLVMYGMIGYFLIHSGIESGIRSKLLSGNWEAWIKLYPMAEVKYKQMTLEDGNPVYIPTESKQPWLIPLPGSRQFPVYAIGNLESGFYPSEQAKSGTLEERP